jgi:Uma2 family endonuclease
VSIDQRTSADAYERLALADPDRPVELHDGVVREKPPATFGRASVIRGMTYSLILQLDHTVYSVDVNTIRVRHLGTTFLMPDLAVIPVALYAAYKGRWDAFAVFDASFPLVVEGWVQPTEDYDVATKIPVYRARGDEEIWRLHPFERTLTVWRKRGDGGYDELVYRGGTVEVASLPGVVVDLEALFEH